MWELPAAIRYEEIIFSTEKLRGTSAVRFRFLGRVYNFVYGIVACTFNGVRKYDNSPDLNGRKENKFSHFNRNFG